MAYIFGPVPSRRLGLSLGVDLIPPKTCTYDCIYCEVGRTTCKTMDIKPYVPLDRVLDELALNLERTKPDTVTIAGSGEPTLNAELDRVISCVRGITATRIAVLTNGSLFWKEEVRNRVRNADILLPTLTTAFPETFRLIHRPCRDLEPGGVIHGLKLLRSEFAGLIWLEVVLLKGLNDGPRELKALKRVIGEIRPDKIQLNTVVRPPAETAAVALDRTKLEEIKDFFGLGADIIADIGCFQKEAISDSPVDSVVEMTRRRPMTSGDLSRALNLPLDQVESLIKGLLIKRFVRRQEHDGKVYYTSEERNTEISE